MNDILRPPVSDVEKLSYQEVQLVYPEAVAALSADWAEAKSMGEGVPEDEVYGVDPSGRLWVFFDQPCARGSYVLPGDEDMEPHDPDHAYYWDTETSKWKPAWWSFENEFMPEGGF